MAKRLSDEELNLRRKARRRLIGAIALALVVVVVLPMMLDNEPRPTGQDIELRIPDPDKVGEFIPGMSIVDSTKMKISTELAGNSDTAKVDANLGQAPVSAPIKPVAKPSSAVSEGFVAQVGAYSSADAAKQEQAKLKKLGFKVYTETVGDKVRVRVGPYAEREQAEKVLKMLEKHGLHPVIMSSK